MARLRSALLLAATVVPLAGCANVPDRVVLDRPTTVDRSNGQPRWLPCMSGDALCR